MITIRRATWQDLDFLLEVDLLGEGYTVLPDTPPLSPEEAAAHRATLASFIDSPNDADAAWVVEDSHTTKPVGMILARFRDRYHEPATEANLFLFRFLDDSIFPTDGRFCEVFNLWVHPDYRRQGIATRLKLLLEDESRQRGIRMVYTHTEATNAHVIELNHKLGYQDVRCGPLWDIVPRVSLVKWIPEA